MHKKTSDSYLKSVGGNPKNAGLSKTIAGGCIGNNNTIYTGKPQHIPMLNSDILGKCSIKPLSKACKV